MTDPREVLASAIVSNEHVDYGDVYLAADALLSALREAGYGIALTEPVQVEYTNGIVRRSDGHWHPVGSEGT